MFRVRVSALSALSTPRGYKLKQYRSVVSYVPPQAQVYDKETRIRRMLYQAGQRGMLELDILMGTWARENLSSLSEADLEQFDKLLSAETPVLLKMLLGQVPDEELADWPVYRQLKLHVEQRRNQSRESKS